MTKLKVYPVDLLGSAPSNKISGEVRQIVRNEDRIFIPTGGPFYTQSLKIWSGTTLLKAGVDYRAKELNRNATIDSGKEVCNAIQILNKNTTFTLEYQLIGGHYTELGEELASFIKGTPLGDLTKIHWDKILYKPLTFPPSAHKHVATDWRGYGESIYLTEQMTLGLTNGRGGVITAVKEEVRRHVEMYVDEYIARNGVVVTDKVPTNNGNVLLVGDGKQPTPLTLDTDALFKELDARYFRNVINPLTRIGAIADSFLPITTGFFNVTAPAIFNRWTSPAGYVEKNGNLMCLFPATDGEVIRYVYGYVREWSTLKSIAGYKATNQQYRPPGLEPDEEIMELLGANENCMIGTIYTVNSNGSATFKEHCIIELNGTLMQESHVLIRLGSRLATAVGGRNAKEIWLYRPTVVRMRDRKFYFFAMSRASTMSTISCWSYDQATDLLEPVVNWTGKKELTKLEFNPDGLEDRIISKSTTVIKRAQADIRPAAMFQDEAVDGEDWVIDVIPPVDKYSLRNSNYGQELQIAIKGDDILLQWSVHLIHTFSSPTKYIADSRFPIGRSLRVRPDLREYTWLRKEVTNAPELTNYTGQLRGVTKQLEDKDKYEFKVPMDHSGAYYDPSSYHRSTAMSLQDGSLIFWRPQSSIGVPYNLNKVSYGTNDFTPEQLYDSYYSGRAVRDAPNRRNETIYQSKLNLENPSPIPLNVSAYPMNDGLVLLQEGSYAYTGGEVRTSYYAYRPSTKIVDYLTMDSGKFSGYDTSDDRVLIESNVPSRAWVATRRPTGVCQYSSMMFQSNIGTARPPMEQTAYADIKLDFENKRFVESTPYKLTEAGQNAIKFAMRSALGDDIHDRFCVWALIVSPLQPNVAMFQAEWASKDAVKFNRLICAARVSWDENRELTGITIRPAEGEYETSNPIVTYLWDISRFRLSGASAIEYNANLTEAHWHVRRLVSVGVASTNTTGSTSTFSYKMTFGADGFPKLNRYATSPAAGGYTLIVATPLHTAMMDDRVGMGVYRVAKPFLNWDWVSGLNWTSDTTKFFCWYTPRPTVSFKLRVIETIDVQIGGVNSKIPAGTYELTDPNHSTVIDPRNKVILIYATLLRGKATLEFSEIAIPESTYSVYIGRCVTDEYGVTEADILPVSRIGNYRPSVKPQGGAFSVSSSTPDKEVLLNWDADIPTSLASSRVTGTLVGLDKVQQHSSVPYSVALNPIETEIKTSVWTSSNPTIATVDQKGTVTGIAIGEATIRCLVNDEIYVSKRIAVEQSNIGVDMSQFVGNVTFDEVASYVKVIKDGRFFVKNKEAAVAQFNGFIHVKSSGGVNGARGYLNGNNIWKGKGTSWNRLDYSKYIVEGWNIVHMEWGDLWIEARLFKSEP